jgi:hypothetical protein
LIDELTGDGQGGYVVISFIGGGDHHSNILGYRECAKGSILKHLIKPISGNYHPDFMNPFINEDPIVSYVKTDS